MKINIICFDVRSCYTDLNKYKGALGTLKGNWNIFVGTIIIYFEKCRLADLEMSCLDTQSSCRKTKSTSRGWSSDLLHPSEDVFRKIGICSLILF